MTDAQISTFRELLEARLSAFEVGPGRREGIHIERAADPADEAQFAAERDMSIRALDHESHTVSAVRSALQRIDGGEYGVCQSCEGDISEKRLAAVPWTPYCIACQERIDRIAKAGEEVAA